MKNNNLVHNLKRFPAIVLIGLVGILSSCSSNTTAASTTTTTIAPRPIVTVPVSTISTSMGSVSYRTTGSGHPLVLIMGFSGSMDAWEPSFVDSLARHYKVVIFDNPGIGGTKMSTAPLTMDYMAEVTNALISALNLSHPYILGWSMGGMIAQALAVKYPQDVSKLVLCATLPGNGQAVAPANSVIEALGNPSSSAIFTLLGMIFPADQSAAAKTYLNSIIKYPKFYIASNQVDSSELQAIVGWTFGKDPAGLKISTIKMPTLIADGAEDVIIPAKNDYELNSIIKGSQILMYPDASHAFLFQDQNLFVPKLLSFLNS